MFWFTLVASNQHSVNDFLIKPEHEHWESKQRLLVGHCEME